LLSSPHNVFKQSGVVSSIVEEVSYDVLDESEPFRRMCHIRVPHSQSDLSDRVFRKLRTGSLIEYYHLDKVFWRCQEHGFSLPDHRLVRDTRDNPWLEVEYIDGSAGDDLVANRHHALSDFLDSYGSILESILENPDEPFNTDQKLEQFMYDGDFYVCDVEPRVAYLDDDPIFPCFPNQRFIHGVSEFFSGVTELYDNGVVSENTVETALSLGDKTLSKPGYFDGYEPFQRLQTSYSSFVNSR
jgi:hypothetical protein